MCSLRGLWNCYAHARVLCQCCFVPSGVFWGPCVSACGTGLCSLAFGCICSCICASAWVELALLTSAVICLLLSTWVWIPRVCCSAILRLSVVSALFPPDPPFFSLYLLYQCDGCPTSLLCGELMAGFWGFVSYGSSLT